MPGLRPLPLPSDLWPTGMRVGPEVGPPPFHSPLTREPPRSKYCGTARGPHVFVPMSERPFRAVGTAHPPPSFPIITARAVLCAQPGRQQAPALPLPRGSWLVAFSPSRPTGRGPHPSGRSRGPRPPPLCPAGLWALPPFHSSHPFPLLRRSAAPLPPHSSIRRKGGRRRRTRRIIFLP